AAVLVGGAALVLWLFNRTPHDAPNPATAVTFRAEADQLWQDTGVEVEARKAVFIRVQGAWRKGQKTCSANGLATGSNDRCVLPEAQPMGLLGRIGDQETPFPLRTFQMLKPDQGGRLFVQVNDLDLADDSGSLQVEIEGGTHRQEAAARPRPTLVQAAERTLTELRARFDDAGEDREGVRQALLDFRCAYAGTLQSVRAAGLLARLSSPLDLWDRETGKELHAATGHMAPVTAVALSPDGLTAASAGQDLAVRLWSLKHGMFREQAVLKGHTAAINSLQFAPDGQTLASAGAEKTVRLWDVARGRLKNMLKGCKTGVVAIAYAPDGKAVVTVGGAASYREFKWWDPVAGTEVDGFLDYSAGVNVLALAPDLKLMAVTGNPLTLWDMTTRKERLKTQPLTYPVAQSLAFAPDGKRLASGEYNCVDLWEPGTGRKLSTLAAIGQWIGPLAFAPDGRRLVTWCLDKQLVLWDVTPGKAARKLKEWPLQDPVRCFAFAPDGRHLVLGQQNGTLSILRLEAAPGR
ncbi:MAG TPA: WD40 repeat domain-containing protein, partial [Gemmataceae bacterium]|nr:WD40 repeat domain-containing protein [Gemmataceae bacterium]